MPPLPIRATSAGTWRCATGGGSRRRRRRPRVGNRVPISDTPIRPRGPLRRENRARILALRMNLNRKSTMNRATTSLLLAALAAATAACEGDSTGGDTPPAEGTVTLDASTGWAFADLDAASPAVTVADPRAGTAWDIAVFATSVMLNGGAAGPGGIEGWCLCQNASASGAEVRAMTPASQLAAFQAVTAADAPADPEAWTSDALAPAIAGWYAYDAATHRVSASPQTTFYVRTAEGDAWARLHVTALAGATRDHAGTVTLEWSLQAEAGGAMGPTRTLDVDVSGGRAYVDLSRGEVSTAADWDLALEGWDIRVNGGVSGSGQAGALAAGVPFDQATNPSGVPAQTYRGDAYGGVFDEHRWYRYNLTGTDHQVWPTFDVYLLRRGETMYKVQITGYYGPAGETRQVSVRYARLDG